MKNKLKSSLILSSLLLNSISTIVLADNQEEEKQVPKEASVEFVADELPTPPVDPTNPDPDPGIPVIPTDPTDPTNPPTEPPVGTDGPLSIDFVSTLYFGENKITGKTENYSARAQGLFVGEDFKNVTNYAQVTDKRGTLEGWILSVKQDTPFMTEASENNKVHELVGAELSFKNAYISTHSEDPEVSTIKEKHIFVSGQEEEVLSTSKGHGGGTFTYNMGSPESLVVQDGDNENLKDDEKVIINKDINLNVPGKAVKKAEKYSTTLIWTLKNAVENR
ncbi:WxL domain-containing protein [Vagococcus xieshaowenii]|nr:WxL domain-containing protein [Vagococcus xieshaowenii]